MKTVGIFVHDLGSREIRVKFDAPIPNAEDLSKYHLSSDSGHVPDIDRVSYYDSDMMSVKISLDSALTNGETYLCQVSDLFSFDGDQASTDPFEFVATDEDRPKILGAFLSVRGCVDVVCDRKVALYSTNASAQMVADGHAPVPMSFVSWVSGQSLFAARFAFNSAQASSKFGILCSGIKDVSGNSCLPEEVPLTLAHEANGYSDLMQARATLAIVADVSQAKGFETAVIRVFFNCPMLSSDILNQSKWHIEQSGAHTQPDTGNSITAPDATDTLSLINLANSSKYAVNCHMLSHAHATIGSEQINTPDATDLETASVLTDAIRLVFTDHCENSHEHLYKDFVNCIEQLSSPLDKANDLKAKFNRHIEDRYELEFSDSYSPIGPIMDFASSSSADEVRDQYTWFADLHVSSDSTEASYFVSFSGLSSEDYASLASGTVVADPLSGPPRAMSVSRSIRGAVVRMDCDVDVDPGSFSVFDLDQDGVAVKSKIKLGSTPSVLAWALNNLISAYKTHISDPDISPGLGAKHKLLDTNNTVQASDYVTSMNLQEMLLKADSLKSKMSLHMESELYHYGRDEGVDFPISDSEDYLADLIEFMRRRLSQHNMSGIGPRVSGIKINPEVMAFHEFPGVPVASAIVRNLVVASLDGAVDGNTLSFVLLAQKSWEDNRSNPVNRVSRKWIVGKFEAADSTPALVSAVARPGFFPAMPSHILTDTIEMYMSKPMRACQLQIGSNIVVSGAPMSITDASWANDRTVVVQVASMYESAYSVQALWVTDVAGNPIYVST